MAQIKQKTIKGIYYQLTKSSSSHEDIPFDEDDLELLFDNMKEKSIQERSINIKGSSRFIVFPSDNDYTLLNIPAIQGFVTGAFANLRNGLPPMLAEQEGENIKFSSLPLGDNQSLSEISFFIINKHGVMLFLNNQLAGNESTISDYLNTYTKESGIELNCETEQANIIDIQSIVEKDVFQRLLHFKRITSYEMKLRVLKDDTPDTSGASGDWENNIIRFMENSQKKLNAESVKIEWMAGTNDIDAKGVTGLVKFLISHKKSKAEKLKVKGINLAGIPDEIDFILDKFRFQMSTKLPAGRKWPETTILFEEMKKDMVAKGAYLAGMN